MIMTKAKVRFYIVKRAIAIILLAVLCAGSLFSCDEGFQTRDHGTRLNSKDYPDKKERLEVFSKFIGTHSAIRDVEFDLFNVNGFGETRSIPGASSRHYWYGVKVDTADVKSWIDFLQSILVDTSIAWPDSLVSLRKEQWVHTSTPLYFTLKKSFSQNEKNKTIIIVYKPEGIIFRDVDME